jgi:hypothetical protein
MLRTPIGLTRAVVVLALGGAALFAAAGVSARTDAIARFTVTVKGTFHSHASETERNCWRSDENDNVTYFTQTVTSDVTDTFASSHPGVVEISAFTGGTPLAGMLRKMPVRIVGDRSFTQAPDEPCIPNDPSPDCASGSKTLLDNMVIGGMIHRSALYYKLAKKNGQIFTTDPSFAWCRRLDSDASWWSTSNDLRSAAPVSRSRLFNRKVRRIAVHGHLAARGAVLDYTITLKRR